MDCRYFNGYKPCGKSLQCNKDCHYYNEPSVNVLLIHLGAIGAVVRSTSLLNSIHKKYPGCRLVWVTDAPSHQLLKGHPLIDHVYSTQEADLLELSSWDFDIVLCIDKSRKAAGVLRRLQIKESETQIFGFVVDGNNGAVKPATVASEELWQIGLSDKKKFFENTKPETQLIHEALELGPWGRAEYNLPLNQEEQKTANERKKFWKQNPNSLIVGINTGCSHTIPAKKFTVDYHRELISQLQKSGFQNIILLGGPEDTLRNIQIADNLNVISSPTENGLRDGLTSIEACDIVITGDSLGMHLAIARKKYVIAWFGPTCAHEIDLYDRGIKLLTKASCSPCWKRVCNETSMCYDLVNINAIINAVSTSRPLSSFNLVLPLDSSINNFFHTC